MDRITPSATILMLSVLLFACGGPGNPADPADPSDLVSPEPSDTDARPQHAPFLQAGEVQTIVSFPEGTRPEGIAVRQTGVVYVGHRQFRTTQVVNQILRIDPGESAETAATLPSSPLAVPGLLGLAVDRPGNLYADSRRSIRRAMASGAWIGRARWPALCQGLRISVSRTRSPSIGEGISM